MQTCRQSVERHFNRTLEAVHPKRRHRHWNRTAHWNVGIPRADGQSKIRVRFSHGQAVGIVLPAEALDVANSHDVLAVRRGGEVNYRIAAVAGAAVVIPIVKVRNGQPVRRKLGAWGYICTL